MREIILALILASAAVGIVTKVAACEQVRIKGCLETSNVTTAARVCY